MDTQTTLNTETPIKHTATPTTQFPDDTPPTTIIEASKGWRSLGLQELWEYRELLFFMVWRDVKVRYKQTILGVLWAILQPLMLMVVFTVFFGGLAQIPSDGVPYPIFNFVALVPWTFFANGLTNSTLSLVNASAMLKKIYFPRLILPISSLLASLVDFALSFVVLIGMILYFMATTPPPFPLPAGWLPPGAPEIAYGIQPSANIIWLPFLLLLAFISALGVGLWLSALNVQFRDVRYSINFLIRIWMFITPIVYPSSLLDEQWRLIYALNPMSGVVEGFRWALLGTDTAPGPMILVSTVVAVVFLITGLFYFRRMEATFADVV